MRTRLLSVLLAASAAVASAASAEAATSLGTNLVPVTNFSGALTFADLMRQADPFCSQIRFGAFCNGPALTLDAAGFPTSLPAAPEPDDTVVARTILVSDSTVAPAGRYTATWAGTGTIELNPGVAELVSSGPGMAAFDVTPTEGERIELNILTTDPDDHLRDLHVLLPGTTSQDQFNPAYLAALEPYTGVRFMDWGRTNESPVQAFADRPKVGDFTFSTDRGVPLEVMVDLANTLDADPWFNVPTHADDAYVLAMAQLIRDRLDPGLVPRVEYSNETWNPGFTQQRFTSQQGVQRGLEPGDDYAAGLEYTAHRALEIWDIWDPVFATRPYRRVLASQSASVFTGDTQLSYRRTTGEPTAGERADEYAIAPYFQPEGVGDDDRFDELSLLTVDQLLDRAAADIAGPVQQQLTDNVALAVRHGVELVAYEGGQHFAVPVSRSNSSVPANKQFSDKLTAANRDPRIGTLYDDYLERWNTTVGGAFFHFTDVTIPSPAGNWGAVETVLQDPLTAPKFQALKRFAASLVDTTAPGTTIDAGVGDAGATNDLTPSFAFSADEAGATFVCRLDGGAPVGCTSPRELALGEGSHSFSVAAVDATGNQDATPALRAFTIDTTGPAIVVERPVAGERFAQGTAAGSSFTCNDPRGVASCAGPASVETATAGARTFVVTAADSLGNLSTASVAYTVDAAAAAAAVVVDPVVQVAPAPVVAVRSLTGLARVRGSLLVRTGMTVLVSCSAGAQRCVGRVILDARGNRLAAGAFSIAPGTSKRVVLRLSPGARRRFGRRTRIDGRLRAQDASGRTVATRKLVLRH